MAELGSSHLTAANPEQQKIIDQTHIGMMSFAGTGPAGKTCFGCKQFDRKEKVRKADLERRCLRWVKWYRGHNDTEKAPVHLFPPSTPACSHFDDRGPS